MDSTQNQKPFKLPASFLYGAASSSHQVEGNNNNNDWWFEEKAGKLPESKQGTDHYNRYAEDFGLAKQIGLNAMRISIEWSRIEPQLGRWDMNAVEHYRKVLQEMKAQGLTRMVTLHHYTLPMWIYHQDGFANKNTVRAFANFSKFVAEQLGSEIDLWVTNNEAQIYTDMSSVQGKWPPFKKNVLRAFKVYGNLAKASNESYKAIKSTLPSAQVGIAHNAVYYEPFNPNSFLDKFAVKIDNWFTNHFFLNKVSNHLDFIGINYYFYNSISVTWKGIQRKNLHHPKSDMGWQTYPEGLYHLILDLTKQYRKPIYITENGIANARDDMRKDFIREHLHWVSKANSEGADTRGYFYWSLTDTHEWQDGFNPKFGLVEIDFEHGLKRTVRPSADIFKEIKNYQK